MAIGTRRTITQSVTIPAGASRGVRRTASALPARHDVLSFEVDDPGIDVIVFTVNGLFSRSVGPDDFVTLVLQNTTVGAITANVTVTLVESAPARKVE
jgi:hypothetical protein